MLLGWGRKYYATGVALWPRLSRSQGTAAVLVWLCLERGNSVSPCQWLKPCLLHIHPMGWETLCSHNPQDATESVWPRLGLDITVLEKERQAALLLKCTGADWAWTQEISQPMAELRDFALTGFHMKVKRHNILCLLGCFWSCPTWRFLSP